MKRLSLIIFLTLPLFATITGPGACVSTPVQGSAVTTLTTIAMTTSGSLLILSASGSANNNPAGWVITDKRNGVATTNAWHHGTQRDTTPSGATNVIWYSFDNGSGGALQTGALHTITATNGTAVNMTLIAECYSGTLTSSSPFDQENGAATAPNATVTSLATGSITPSQNGELVISAGGFRAGTTYTANAVTVDARVDWVTGVFNGGAVGNVIQTTAAAVNNTWSMTGGGQLAVTIASFKAAPAASGSVKHKVTTND